MRSLGLRRYFGKIFAFWLAAIMSLSAPAAAKPAGDASNQLGRNCPAQLDGFASCFSLQSESGAWILTAVPKKWNGILVVHAHGGPRLGSPQANDPDEDLERYAAMVRSGFAWTGSTYRRGGYGVRMAAEDVDQSRAIFWKAFGKPSLTILHGQSWGGNVAAKLAELRSVDADGTLLYNGVLLTNSVLRGGVKAYSFRANLRAVYQYFCRNHPQPDETQYPVWQGLPVNSSMTKAELRKRVNACTGINVAASSRTPEQQRNLAAITGATGVSEAELFRHLEWATFTFQDLVQQRLGGRNPFDNKQMIYEGSGADIDLNKNVERFVADPVAVRLLSYDSDLTGLIIIPTLAIHWASDPVASPLGDLEYQSKIKAAGNSDLFLSLQTSKGSHAKLSDPELLAALEALVLSAGKDRITDAGNVTAICRALAERFSQECTITQ